MRERVAPKRISLLLPSLKFGGAERVALNLACALQDRGLDVEFLLMSYEGEFLEEALLRFNVVDLNCDRTWKLPGRLLAHMRSTQSDALISSFWKLNLCACIAKALSPKFRLLVWEHGMVSRGTRRQKLLFGLTASIAYRFSSRVVCVSNGVLQDISKLTLGLKSRLIVIFNPIQPPVAASSEQRPCSREVGRVLWVGRMTPEKNPGLLLDAVVATRGRNRISLCYIGDGSERAVLEQRVEQLGLSRFVSFQGFQADPYLWMVESDLLVMSSNSEGFGNVLVEALYCGLRVVSTDCGLGVHDIIQGRHGSVVPVGDAAAMSQAICKELSSGVGKKAQMDAAQRFLPSVIADEFLAVLS